MVFASFDFLFLFLPLFLLAQIFLPGKNITYALFSLFFYFVGEGWFVSIVLASVLFNFSFGLLIDANEGNRRKLVLMTGVAVNLCSLFFFKYIGFFTSSVIGIDGPTWANSVHLPLGISFFTFHSISYLIDIYRRDAKPEKSIVNLSLYILMFPQLIAGPILRFHTIADQLKSRTVNLSNVYNGLALFCFGMGQKVLIADTLAGVADPLFLRMDTLSSATAWLAAIAYTFQIYFDFSGYSNMAIGLGWMTGFYFQWNFNFPYSSTSVTDFWRRWHISLSNWFRDYLYIPMGGNRSGKARTYINLVTVFFLCGLWHGAAWTFVLWGLYHGSLLVLERFALGKFLTRLYSPLRHGYTMLAVIVGWVLFRSETATRAGAMLSKMFLISDAPEDLSILQVLSGEEILAFVLATAFSIPLTVKWIARAAQIIPTSPPWSETRLSNSFILGLTICLPVLAASGLKIITGAFSPFIYFRF